MLQLLPISTKALLRNVYVYYTKQELKYYTNAKLLKIIIQIRDILKYLSFTIIVMCHGNRQSFSQKIQTAYNKYLCFRFWNLSLSKYSCQVNYIRYLQGIKTNAIANKSNICMNITDDFLINENSMQYVLMGFIVEFTCLILLYISQTVHIIISFK